LERCRIGAADSKIIPTKLGHPREPIIRKNKHNRARAAEPDCGSGVPPANSGEHARGELVRLGLILGRACLSLW
jgi:hypothetical protein